MSLLQNAAYLDLKLLKITTTLLNKFFKTPRNLSCRDDKYFRINLFEIFQQCYEFFRLLRDYVDCMSIYS